MEKKHRKKLIVVCVCIVLVVGMCVPGVVKTLRSQPLDTELALADFDTMCEILEENFPYIHMAERQEGFDYDTRKAAYRAQVAKVTTLEGLYREIHSFLLGFGGIGHLAVMNSTYYYTALESFEMLGDADAGGGNFAYLYDVVNNEASRQAYAQLADRRTSSSFGIDLDTNLAFEMLDDSTAYVSVKTFAQEAAVADHEWWLDLYGQLADVPRLVIDITGCNGGSDYYWMDNIVGPNISEPLWYHAWLLYMDGAITRDILDLLDSGSEDLSAVATLPGLPQQDFGQFRYLGENQAGVGPLFDVPLYTGDIYVLVNGNVGSACEAFAMFCSQTGFATLVGQPTGGDGAGHNPTYAALPNSGLVIVFRVEYALNPDGSSNVESGTQPDIYIGNPKVKDHFLSFIE